MKAFIQHLPNNNKKLVILAGAGISIDSPSNLLSGQKFIEKIMNVCILPEYIKDAISLIKTSGHTNPGYFIRFEELLHYIRITTADRQFSILNCLKDCEIPNENHYLLAMLILKGHTVITTNFDNLIELAYNNIKIENSPQLKVNIYEEEFDLQKTSDSFNYLWKIHGSLIRDELNCVDSIQTEIPSMLKNSLSKKISFLKGELFKSDLIVLGYSGSDDFDIIPAICDTSSGNKILWIDHNTEMNIEITGNFKTKKKENLLGLARIASSKRGQIKILKTATTKVLRYLCDSEKYDFSGYPDIGKNYKIPDSYFTDWADSIGITLYQKYKITKAIFEFKRPGLNIAKPETTIDQAHTEIAEKFFNSAIDQRVDYIIGQFNTNQYLYDDIYAHYEELEQLFQIAPEFNKDNILNIKACIEYRLGNYIESEDIFQSLRAIYRKRNWKTGELGILLDMFDRDMLDAEGISQINDLCMETGYFPLFYERKLMYYYKKLKIYYFYEPEVDKCPVHKTEALDDLTEMRAYYLATGDLDTREAIDNLLNILKKFS